MENKKNINKKSFARFFAVQILYSYLNQKDDEEENINDLFSFLEEYYISEEFSDNEEEYRKNVNKNFLNELLDGVVEHFDAIDLLLEKNLTGKYTFNVIDNLIKVIEMKDKVGQLTEEADNIISEDKSEGIEEVEEVK